jgi:hypothetical protein
MQEEEVAVAAAAAIEVTEGTKGVVVEALEAVVGELMLWTWTMTIVMLMKGKTMMRWTLSLAGIIH